jgi:hypothetical protein
MKLYVCVTNCSQYKRLVCVVLSSNSLFTDGQIYNFEILPIIKDTGNIDSKIIHLYHHSDVRPSLIVQKEIEM